MQEFKLKIIVKNTFIPDTKMLGLLCLLIFGSYGSPLFSQEYSYRHYTVKDGLVQNQVISMFQDSKGYLWLGTKGGVSRFDGLRFKNFTANDGLLSNQIYRIFEDAEGGINFSSLIGISRYKNGKIVPVIKTDTINSKNDIVIIPHFTKTEICILNSGRTPIYIGKYDSILIKLLPDLNNIKSGKILKEEAFNKYWLNSSKGGLYYIANDSLKLFSNEFSGRIIKDKSGRIYGFDGKYIYQPDTINNQLKILYHFQLERISGLHDLDYDGNAYFGYNQKKIIVFDGLGIKEYKKKFNYINGLLIDMENNLWVATETGFYKKISSAFENFTVETGSNEYVWSIVEDEQKNIWFASYGDGLCKWDGQNITKINSYRTIYSTSKGDYFYTGAFLASNQHIYFPVREDGILEFDGYKFSLIPDLPHGSVLDVYEDSLNNILLAASTAGLIVLKDLKTPFLYKKDFIHSRKFIKTIAQDKYGRYWLGGEYMLNIFDGTDFIEFPNEKYDYNAGAISIFKDHRNNLWLGTTSGLYFFNFKEFIKVAKNTLQSQVVSFVELDTTKLVMGVSKGLAILDLSAFYQNSEEHIEILDESKGFLGFDCIRNGILKDSYNNIWVAASDRVVKFYPDRLKGDTVKPSIRIENITVTGSKADQIQTFDMGKKSDTIIKLPHFLKNFRIDFHAIHFFGPEKITYRHRLIGYNEDWTLPSSERYVSYTNLLPGKYTFKVMAQNIDGFWSRTPDSVTFEIVPAFWQTLTFKLSRNILVLFIFLLIGYLILNFLQKRKKKNMETEKQISELQLKTIKSQMDPHFTFNALNSISSVIYKEDKEKAYRYFTKFSKLIRASLDVSDKISRTLAEEIDFTKNYLDLEKIRFKENFKYKIHVDAKVNQQMLVPKMIIQSYAENAVKHGLKHLEKNRRLTITISQFKKLIQISIEDNGIGRELAAKQSQFSTGKGLAIMSNIYDLYFKLYKIRINQEFEDLYDESGKSAGTIAKLYIPTRSFQ